MRISLRKWGNSLGVRIPKVFAVHMGMTEGQQVDVEIVDRELVIRKPGSALNELLTQVTAQNIHEEIDWGASVGKEVW